MVAIKRFFSLWSNLPDEKTLVQFQFRQYRSKKNYKVTFDDGMSYFVKEVCRSDNNDRKTNNQKDFLDYFAQKKTSFTWLPFEIDASPTLTIISQSFMPVDYKLYPRKTWFKDFAFLNSFLKNTSVVSTDYLLEKYNNKFPNVSSLLNNCDELTCLAGPCHGDLASNNLFIDESKSTFMLIDFENFSADAPGLTDVVALALAYSFELGLIESVDIETVYGLIYPIMIECGAEITVTRFDILLACAFLVDLDDRLAKTVYSKWSE